MQRSFGYCLLVIIAILPCAATAALGGKVDLTTSASPSNARVQLLAPSNGYTVREVNSAAGGSVREYISAQGRVFAVAWKTPNLPDLTQLLGDYFPAFSAAMAERRAHGIRGPVSLRQSDLVVESNGRMRAYFGRAYDPNLLPPQISIEEIQ